ncbi:hypothetical protein SUNI508_00365 [Seiridium unicorne]|uniref:Chitin deacetylase n=1 Tax=Seiridium unicorne TaxID=138068 RepID=A0ABR2V6H6_9PEZI
MRSLITITSLLVSLHKVEGLVAHLPIVGDGGAYVSKGSLQPSLGRRDVSTGGSCGPSAGNAVCASGLCCSSAGVCGTGTSFCSSPDCQISFGPACDGNEVPLGEDTSKVPRPTLGNVPYGVSISHCTVNGRVALTFDDGPYIYTSELLDILKKNGVRATFFVVGNNGGKGQIELASTGYPAIIQRMYSDGHQIGSHSWSHQNMSQLTAQQRHDQIIRNEIALVDILGFFPTYFRPPYTQCSVDCSNDLGALGYHVVNYDIDTRDWQGDYTYAQNTYSTILTQHSPGSSAWISLAHDIQPNTVHGFAQYMIDQAEKLGYELVTLGQCLGDPEANWYRDPTNGQSWTGRAVTSSAISTVASTTLTSLLQATSTTSSVSTAITAQISTMTTPPTAKTTIAPISTTTVAPILITTTSKEDVTALPVTSQTRSALPIVTSQSSTSSSTVSSSMESSNLATPVVTPTAVSGNNFGIGTTSQTTRATASTSSSIAVKPSASGAGDPAGSSLLGLVLAVCGLLVLL